MVVEMGCYSSYGLDRKFTDRGISLRDETNVANDAEALIMTNRHGPEPGARRVLPVVVDMCNLVNGVFVRYVGPIAHEIAEELFEHWREKGKTGPSGVGHYIHLLSEHIVDESQRSSFREEATTVMREALRRRI